MVLIPPAPANKQIKSPICIANGGFSDICFYRYRRLIMTPRSARVLRIFSCLSILLVIMIVLLKSELYWEQVCEWSANLWCCNNCLRELLADHSAHLADGLHTADQIFLQRHDNIPPAITIGVNQEYIQFRNLRCFSRFSSISS